MVVPLGVELVLEPLLEPPLAPIELVPLEPLLLVSVLPLDEPPLVEPLPPAVLPEPLLPMLEPEGLVLLELLEPVPPAPAPAVPSRFWHAPRESAATTARTAAAVWVIDVFIKNSLWGLSGSQIDKGSRDCPMATLGRLRDYLVSPCCSSL